MGLCVFIPVICPFGLVLLPTRGNSKCREHIVRWKEIAAFVHSEGVSLAKIYTFASFESHALNAAAYPIWQLNVQCTECKFHWPDESKHCLRTSHEAMKI
jgi:hypothetical protein